METIIHKHLRGGKAESNRRKTAGKMRKRGENILGVEFVQAGTILDKDDDLDYQLP